MSQWALESWHSARPILNTPAPSAGVFIGLATVQKALQGKYGHPWRDGAPGM
ncbi:MAG TPA: hypothetical protein VN408_07260 [Actinoplanes sp.]|nr:hypothetical protein [Actinoplanes sp.]